MHEMALVRSVLDIVLEQAEAAHAAEVKRVTLTIGYGRDVVEDLVEGLFRHLARDTIAANAEIDLIRVPITVQCNQCGMVFPINLYREDTWECPSCHARLDYTLQTGMEFLISGMEIVSDHSHDEAAADEAAADEAEADTLSTE